MTGQAHQGELAGTRWDPAQYSRFGDHRLRPALELLERIDSVDPSVIYDLGCGAGQVTRMISARWPGATVTGVDNSPEMLERAEATESDIVWQAADIATWVPDQVPDIIYSNAALHWLEDHSVLLPALFDRLAPGGWLAVQMPLSWGEPSHRLMREVLEDGGPGGTRLGTDRLREAVARKWVAEPEDYYRLLARLTPQVDIWTTRYLQVLEGENPVLEWVRGTGLRPILHDLDDQARAGFLDEYSRRLAIAYPLESDGRTLYPFPRLFIVARKPG